MKKQWVKNADFSYTFEVDGQKTGEMEIQFNTPGSKATCKINGQLLEINRTGFWRSNIEIMEGDGRLLLKAYPEKWYANSSVIEFEGKIYKLLIRNNPLAEFTVTENDKDVLAYGLATENRELKLRITTHDNSHFILDFLLWYLFLPIANENMGDTYSFLLSQAI